MTFFSFLTDCHWERDYLGAVVRSLKQSYALSSTPMTFVLTPNADAIPEAGENVVVILISDEKHAIPRYHNDVRIVFKQYVPSVLAPNVHPIPLGCMNGFPDLAVKSLNDRQIDFSFVGYLHESRRDFAGALRAACEKEKFSCHIGITPQPATGMPVGDYAHILNNTKVALCPSGAASPESFRVFEAARAGCVVLTSPKPRTWFYDRFPGIQIESWQGLDKALALLLSDTRVLEALQNKHLEWWENTCSPGVVARYIEALVLRSLAQGNERFLGSAR